MLHPGIKKLFASIALSCCVAPALAADNYPSRPVTVVSPFPAGGATDTLTRLLADRMSKALGQSMIVENKAGGGTNIGASYVARSQPDGYTILMATNSTLVTNRFLYKELPYDPDGFTPVGMVAIGPMVLLSTKKQPFKSVQDVVDYAKAHPGKLSFASFGSGTSSHLAGELFKERAGIDMLHVPFKGATTALPVLINGEVDLFFDMVATGMPQVDADKLNVFGVTSLRRLSNRPDLPTIAEQGYPGFDLSAWFSFVAPQGTPDAALQHLRGALGEALKDDAVRQKILAMGLEPRSGSVEELAKKIKIEQPVVGQLVKQANIPMQ